MERLRVVWDWSFQWMKDIASEWSTDRVGGLAAEIAFFALLGFFPAVIALAATLGSAETIVGASTAADVESWLVDQMVEIFGGENSLEQTTRELFEGGNGGALTLGAVVALYAASRGFTAVVRALDIAYDHVELRGWLSTRLVGLGLTLLTVVVAAVVMVLIVVGPLFGGGAEIADDLGVAGWFTTLWTWLRWPVVFLALVTWATTMYHVAPHHTSPWRTEIPGALIAAVWWSVVSLGFSSYLQLASSGANAIFGLLGGAISLLFWLYLMAMGLLLGAEINSLRAVQLGIELDGERWSARPLRRGR